MAASKALSASQYEVNVDISTVSETELAPYITLQRATNYLAGAMIFLSANPLLRRKLTKDDIKSRLLGHWGTCPGINLVYAHCNYMIKKHNLNMFLVTGPGHGAPANHANLYLEGSLAKFYPQYKFDEEGITLLVRGFSWPGGFPSHVNSEVPGQIHEGGELGYSLAVSFGAVMDNPDLIVTCIVGDGEAETGPTATAWHSIKYLDPKESGAVLPILHVNGFKISERTIYGCMSDDELAALFSGFGYQCRIVGKDLDTIQQDMAASLEWALGEIRAIQKAARSGDPIWKPRWPMICLRSPKGWTGPKASHGVQIEGSFHAHQVPLPNAKTDSEEFELLEKWLSSYHPEKLFNEDFSPVQEILDCLPPEHLRMGQRPETYMGYRPLDLPDWKEFGVHEGEASEMKATGKYLAKAFTMNKTNLRLFSPDEMVSNKLDVILDVTNRNFQWDPDLRGKNGRVIEVLSEHCCQGWLQGYTLTGRTGIFPSYEAFLGIITTMVIQYAKFVKMGEETKWRQPNASINYVETSTLWRQEHNGFSHQNPAFINNLINLKANIVRVYLPPDANCMVCTMDHCLRSKNYVNLMIGSKHETPLWLTPDEAERHCVAGCSVWQKYSTEHGINPDVVLVGCGVEVTFEVIAAAALLRKEVPTLCVRVVNVTDLMVLAKQGGHPHALNSEAFDSIFTRDRPIIFNFHGYPTVIKSLLYDRHDVQNRLRVHGYNEEGTTTTPFRMLTANGCSRYDIAIDAISSVMGTNQVVGVSAHGIITDLQHRIREHHKYINANGVDPPHLMDRPTFKDEEGAKGVGRK